MKMKKRGQAGVAGDAMRLLLGYEDIDQERSQTRSSAKTSALSCAISKGLTWCGCLPWRRCLVQEETHAVSRPSQLPALWTEGSANGQQRSNLLAPSAQTGWKDAIKHRSKSPIHPKSSATCIATTDHRSTGEDLSVLDDSDASVLLQNAHLMKMQADLAAQLGSRGTS